jgi:hypothetical protein
MTEYSLEVANSSFTLNGAFFSNVTYGAGSGVIDSFVRIQTVGNEQGFNTSGSLSGQPDVKGGAFTHDLRLADVPTIFVGGVAYREFRLDINQEKTILYCLWMRLRYTKATRGA